MKKMTGLEAIKFMEQGGKVSAINDSKAYYEIKGNTVWYNVAPTSIVGEAFNFNFSDTYVEYVEPKSLTGWERMKRGENCYYMLGNSTLLLTTEENNSTNNNYYNLANYFSTREKADEIDFKQTLLRQLQRFSDENGGNEIDWNDEDQSKYHINYSYHSNRLRVNSQNCLQEVGCVYFISKNIAKQAIELFHDDLIKYFTARKDT